MPLVAEIIILHPTSPSTSLPLQQVVAVTETVLVNVAGVCTSAAISKVPGGYPLKQQQHTLTVFVLVVGLTKTVMVLVQQGSPTKALLHRKSTLEVWRLSSSLAGQMVLFASLSSSSQPLSSPETFERKRRHIADLVTFFV